MLFMIVSVTECLPSHNRSLDPKVHTHWLVTALFLSWSAIELVRYPFYALSLWNKCPYVLEWLRYSRSPLCVIDSGLAQPLVLTASHRYTLFIPLYPIGFSVERTSMNLQLFRARRGMRSSDLNVHRQWGCTGFCSRTSTRTASTDCRCPTSGTSPSITPTSWLPLPWWRLPVRVSALLLFLWDLAGPNHDDPPSAVFPQNYSYMFLQRKKKISSSPPKAIRSK